MSETPTVLPILKEQEAARKCVSIICSKHNPMENMFYAEILSAITSQTQPLREALSNRPSETLHQNRIDEVDQLKQQLAKAELELKQSERKAKALDWIERNHPRITSWKLRNAEFPGWNWLIQQLDDEKMVSRSIENKESLLSAIEAAISQEKKE